MTRSGARASNLHESAGPLLVLFDVDGTLVNAAGAGRRGLEEAFRRVFGVDHVARLARHVRFEGKTDPVILDEMALAVGVPREQRHARSRELEAAYLEALREELARPDPQRRVLPGVVALLEDLRSRDGVVVGLLTGNIEAGAWAKLAALGIDTYFTDGGFSSDHTDRREIARIARQKISRRTGLEFSPGRVVVVGDTEHDVDCARHNGFRIVAVGSGWGPRERLAAARPDALFDDLSDLPGVIRAFGLA